MKILAELACARAPTLASVEPKNRPESSPHRHKNEDSHLTLQDTSTIPKNMRNSIKDLFECKAEISDKKPVDQVKLIKLPDKSRRQKKHITKVGQHNLPLIRTSQFQGGMAERKKRRREEGSKKINSSQAKTIKDVYDFDDEESASDSGITSFRTVPKEINMSALLSKTIGDTLTNGKTMSAIGENLESMVDKKFKDTEKMPSKAKNDLKDIEDKQETVIGEINLHSDIYNCCLKTGDKGMKICNCAKSIG